MKPLFPQTLRSRWFAACVHAALWLLLYLSVRHFGGQAPDFREADAPSVPVQSPAPVTRLEQFFAADTWPKAPADTNSLNPFVTRHFLPPAPPAPTTRKLELTYLGFYETAGSPRHAVIKLADGFVVSRLGAKVATNLYVADMTLHTLTLTNPAAQTNLLPVNAKKEIEVPIQ